jgi:hypothetical protein
LIFAVASLGGFGVTSDSPSLFYAGDRHLFWLLHPFTRGSLDFFAADPPNFHTAFFRFPEPEDPLHYPVFPGFIAAVTSAIFADALGWMGPIDGHHLGLAVLQAANLYVFARLAISLFGATAGGSATLMLAFFPSIIGHAINNAKDLPCAILYGSSLMAGGRGLARRSPWDLVACGVLAGVGLACKLNAVFALITFVLWFPMAYALFLRRDQANRAWLTTFLGVSYGVSVALAWVNSLSPSMPVWVIIGIVFIAPTLIDMARRNIRVRPALVAAYVAIPAVAVAVFVLLWPWLWAGQSGTFLMRMTLYIQGMARFGVSQRPGWTDYPLRCLVFMTPPLVLAFAAFGMTTGWRGGRERLGLWGLLLLWLALPLVRIAIPYSNFYDANRHFIEYVAPLCILAGLGIAVSLEALRRIADRRLRFGSIAALTVAVLAALVIPIVDYHPYEVTYFNWLAGGLGGAQQRGVLYIKDEDWRSQGIEGDYWHSSIRDFLRQVGAVVPPSALISYCGTMQPQARANWTGPPLRETKAILDGEYMYVAPREAFCSWSLVHFMESWRPVLYRVTRDGGLIYEILGPMGDHRIAPVSPRTIYDTVRPR